MGKARLEIPNYGTATGFSDVLAMGYGRLLALTLSDNEGFVVVTLSDRSERVIGRDALTGEITIGLLIKER